MSTLFRRIVSKLQKATCPSLRYCTAVENQAKVEHDPIISKLQYDDENMLYQKPRQVWLENLNTVEEKKLGLITLHPHIYADAPRIDIIHQNVRWQRLYRWVVSIRCNYICESNRNRADLFVYSLTRIRKRVPKNEVVVGSLGHKKDWVELAMEVYVRHYGEMVEERTVLDLQHHISTCCHFISV